MWLVIIYVMEGRWMEFGEEVGGRYLYDKWWFF